MTSGKNVDVLMLLGTKCPHCPGVLHHLTVLVKKGEITRLSVINIEQDPDTASILGIRSVPWVKIGEHILTGAQTLDALQQRVEWAKEEASQAAEFDYLLSEAQVEKVIELIKQENSKMSTIIELLGDSGTVLSTRIGIGVVMEEFAGSPMLQDYIPELDRLAHNKDSRIRADACHYLGLTGSQEAIRILKQHLDDEEAEVREVVQESLEVLGA